MSMFLTVVLVLGIILAVWLLFQLLVGFGMLVFVLAWLMKVFGRLVSYAFKESKVAIPYDGSAHPCETIGEPLSIEFKQNMRGQLAPDMWTDGRRLYFEVEGKSYSVPADLEYARKRKSRLKAEAAAAKTSSSR